MPLSKNITLADLREADKKKPSAASRGMKKQKTARSVDMSKVACVILAGGQGTRLYPLSKNRCKPAIEFGGRYRLIDVPISNAIGSGIQTIFVLTQFLARSLSHHILHTYTPNTLTGGFIEVLSAEQRANCNRWYSGTADAVRQNLDYLLEIDAEYVLILSGDQLYRMDFCAMLKKAVATDVDVLVATLAVEEKAARRMGILKVNEDHDIVDFHEKPTSLQALDRLRTSPEILKKMGFSTGIEKPFLGSMGIYLFKRQALIEMLESDLRDDFGKHIIPAKVAKGKIGAFAHNGYWEDIGTVESFFEANLSLAQAHPPFDLYSDSMPIFTTTHTLPGAKISGTQINQAIICEGSVIDAHEITKSIIGQRSYIGKRTVIQNSYIMGNDPNTALGTIGDDCHINKAILDKQVTLKNRVLLVNKQNLSDYESDLIYVRDGIIVVPRGVTLPEGFIF